MRFGVVWLAVVPHIWSTGATIARRSGVAASHTAAAPSRCIEFFDLIMIPYAVVLVGLRVSGGRASNAIMRRMKFN